MSKTIKLDIPTNVSERVNRKMLNDLLIGFRNGDLNREQTVTTIEHLIVVVTRDMPPLQSVHGLSGSQSLAIACGNEPYADDKVCPSCNGRGYISAI